MSAPAFLPLLDPTAASLIPSLALLGPLLVPADLTNAILPTLPPQATYYVQAESSSDDLISFLDNGAEKIVVSSSQLGSLDGVARERIIVKIDESSISDVQSLSKSACGIIIATDSVHTPKSLGVTDTHIFLQPTSPSASGLPEQIKSAFPSSYILPTSLLTASKSTSTHVGIWSTRLGNLSPKPFLPRRESINLESTVYGERARHPVLSKNFCPSGSIAIPTL
jgi:phosphoribosyl-ATP pyrophosphohydrolase/phosphoribosyl-AMP cyclohydrolase/histidinol dehydrogenase